MAKESSKKRKHRSPDHSTTGNPKRTRAISRGADEPESMSAHHAKSVFRGDKDPYYPGQTAEGLASDVKRWKMRVKVLSSPNDDDEIFKDAVQGLVKLCFPQGVIQELGTSVVEQHMRERHAPEENISHMREVFDAEMVHRLSWILAEHLTTPHLIEVGVSSVIGATNRLHGRKFDREVLDDIIFAFHQLRDNLGTDDTEGLVNGAGLSMPSIDPEVPGTRDDKEDSEDKTLSTIEGGNDVMDDSADSLHDQLAAAAVSAVYEHISKKRRSKKNNNDTRQQSSTNDADPGIEDGGSSVQTVPNLDVQAKTQAKDPNKVSKDWMWDVDAGLLIVDDIPVHFKRMGDLFAYHALAAARSDLGPDATKGKTRKEIEQRIRDMSEDERTRWAGGFDKLLSGNLKMLDRVAIYTQAKPNSTTPVLQGALLASPGTKMPAKKRDRSKRRKKDISINGRFLTDADVISHGAPTGMPIQDQARVRQEFQADRNQSSSASMHAAEGSSGVVARNEVATRVPSTKKTISEIRRTGSSQPATPIVDILWGESGIQSHELGLISDRFMSALNERVPIKTMPSQSFGSVLRELSRGTIRSRLDDIIHKHRFQVSNLELRCTLEDGMIPWLVANISAFPEVASSLIILMHIMPDVTAVVDLVCGL